MNSAFLPNIGKNAKRATQTGLEPAIFARGSNQSEEPIGVTGKQRLTIRPPGLGITKLGNAADWKLGSLWIIILNNLKKPGGCPARNAWAGHELKLHKTHGPLSNSPVRSSVCIKKKEKESPFP